MMKTRSDLVGKVFGKLKVVSYVGVDARCNSRWLCVCECGAERVHTGTNLKRGNILTCGQAGCRRRVADRAEDHPDWHVFMGMLSRCHNPRFRDYPRYGGRGIYVCDRWREGGFKVFIGDMGPRPNATYSIERIDNDGPYSPDNCRWATDKEQSLNKRNTVMLTHNGEARPMREWADVVGIKYGTLRARILKGWPADKALTVGVVKGQPGERNGIAVLTWELVRRIRAEYVKGSGEGLARKYGVSASTINQVVSGKRWVEEPTSEIETSA